MGPNAGISSPKTSRISKRQTLWRWIESIANRSSPSFPANREIYRESRAFHRQLGVTCPYPSAALAALGMPARTAPKPFYPPPMRKGIETKASDSPSFQRVWSLNRTQSPAVPAWLGNARAHTCKLSPGLIETLTRSGSRPKDESLACRSRVHFPSFVDQR